MRYQVSRCVLVCSPVNSCYYIGEIVIITVYSPEDREGMASLLNPNGRDHLFSEQTERKNANLIIAICIFIKLN